MLRGRMAAVHAAAAPLARRDTPAAADALRALQLTLSEGAALVESWAKSDATALLAVIAAALAAPRSGAAFDAAREALCARITQLAAASGGVVGVGAAATDSFAALAADAAGWAVADAAAVRFDAAVLPSAMATLFEDAAALHAAMGTIGTSREQLSEGMRRHGFAFADVDKAMARAQGAAATAEQGLEAALDMALRAEAERDALPAAWAARPEALLDARDVIATAAATATGARGTWRGAPVALLRCVFETGEEAAGAEAADGAEATAGAAARFALFREVSRLAALPPSPQLARVHGVVMAPAAAVVVERCEGVLLPEDAKGTNAVPRRCGSLASLLRRRPCPLSPLAKLRLARGIAAGLAALHTAAAAAAPPAPARTSGSATGAAGGGIITHGALSPATVLLAPEGPKLCGYGFARIAPMLLRTTPFADDDDGADADTAADANAGADEGALRWRAPETLRAGAPPSVAADVYALGMLCHALAAWEVPFVGVRGRDALEAAVAAGRAGRSWPAPPPAAAHEACAAALVALAERCCVAEAWARPDAAQLLPALDAALLRGAQEEEEEARAAQAALDAIESVPIVRRR
jgi:hypothetical protein